MDTLGALPTRHRDPIDRLQLVVATAGRMLTVQMIAPSRAGLALPRTA
jgi:PIN domain nuclease of toxin-antitoxin system